MCVAVGLVTPWLITSQIAEQKGIGLVCIALSRQPLLNDPLRTCPSHFTSASQDSSRFGHFTAIAAAKVKLAGDQVVLGKNNVLLLLVWRTFDDLKVLSQSKLGGKGIRL